MDLVQTPACTADLQKSSETHKDAFLCLCLVLHKLVHSFCQSRICQQLAPLQSKNLLTGLQLPALLCRLCTRAGSQLRSNESHLQGLTGTIRDGRSRGPEQCDPPLRTCGSYPEQSSQGSELGRLWVRDMLAGHPPSTHIPRDHQPCRTAPGHGQGRANANATVKFSRKLWLWVLVKVNAH